MQSSHKCWLHCLTFFNSTWATKLGMPLTPKFISVVLLTQRGTRPHNNIGETEFAVSHRKPYGNISVGPTSRQTWLPQPK